MYSKFQSKLRVLDADAVKQKTSLFSVQGKSAWYVFMVFCSFVLLSSVSVTQNKTIKKLPSKPSCPPIKYMTFLVNVKCRMDGSHRKPCICLSFDFLIQYSANGACSTWVSMQEYVTSLWLLWKSYIFPVTYTETPWLDLRGMINVPGIW